MWQYDPVDSAGQQSNNNWKLDGVDVLISASGHQSYLVLFSSTDAELVDHLNGTVARSLLDVLRPHDASVHLTQLTALNFMSADVYLWLAQQAEAQKPLGGGTKIHAVSRISAEEDKRRFRSSTLSGDVDMKRISFLNAIAEMSALGPAVVTITQPNSGGRIERVQARVWQDGSFGLLMTETRFRNVVDNDLARLEAVKRLAYRYLPMINQAYAGDADWALKDRDWLVISKRVELADHYRALAQAHPRWADYVADVAP